MVCSSPFHNDLLASAYELDAIDMVCIDFRDNTILEIEGKNGQLLGFTGKQVIHPNQIETVNKLFTPTKEAIHKAKSLVAAFEKHCAGGKGVFEFDGIAIDLPGMI